MVVVVVVVGRCLHVRVEAGAADRIDRIQHQAGALHDSDHRSTGREDFPAHLGSDTRIWVHSSLRPERHSDQAV